MDAYNRLVLDPKNEKLLYVCHEICKEFVKQGWLAFWENLNYYISLKSYRILAIPPLQETAPNAFELDGQVFRKVDDVIKRDSMLDKKTKILIELILKNQLTKRLLKERALKW